MTREWHYEILCYSSKECFACTCMRAYVKPRLLFALGGVLQQLSPVTVTSIESLPTHPTTTLRLPVLFPWRFLSNIANTNCLYHPLPLLSGPLRPCVHQNQGNSPRTWWVHSVLDDCVLECVLMLPFIVLFLFCFVLCVFSLLRLIQRRSQVANEY